MVSLCCAHPTYTESMFVVQVINSYLNMLKTQVNNLVHNHVFVFQSYLAVLWDNERYDTLLYSKVISTPKGMMQAVLYVLMLTACLSCILPLYMSEVVRM